MENKPKNEKHNEIKIKHSPQKNMQNARSLRRFKDSTTIDGPNVFL